MPTDCLVSWIHERQHCSQIRLRLTFQEHFTEQAEPAYYMTTLFVWYKQISKLEGKCKENCMSYLWSVIFVLIVFVIFVSMKTISYFCDSHSQVLSERYCENWILRPIIMIAFYCLPFIWYHHCISPHLLCSADFSQVETIIQAVV